MVQSTASTPQEYLSSLAPEHRRVVAAVRKLVRANLPAGYQEAMNWGMLSYQVPLKRFPDTYNGQPLLYAALAAQKNHYALYLMNLYADPARLKEFQAAFAQRGLKLDMGKSCVRFRALDELPLDALGRVVAATPLEDFLEFYAAHHPHARKRSSAAAKRVKKPAARKR